MIFTTYNNDGAIKLYAYAMLKIAIDTNIFDFRQTNKL